MALNVTTAVIGGGCQRAVASPSLAQWDRGQVLKITGVELPMTYNVEFCCQGDLTTTTMLGNADGVEIPNLLLQRGLPIIAYLVLHEGQDDRETEYWITIYVKQRAMPPSVTPDPEQADIIDQLVAALDEGVTAAENAAAQAVAQVEHYPTVIDGTWHVWSALTENWVDTEVPATGPAGRGITGVTQNADYTLTLTFTDGTDWTTPTPVRGATGATPSFTIGTVTTGAAGSSAAASITGTAENPVLSLTIPQGLKGDPGNGDAIAETFSASKAYPAGAYVIYSGSLYRFTAAHAAGAWTGTDAVAAVLGNDVADLKGDINIILTDNYIFDSISIDATAANWRLNESDGLCSSNYNYQLVKYKVTAGDRIKVVASDRFQFQTSALVPSSGTSNRVGATYGAGTYFLTVPETATYLIFSEEKTDGVAVAYVFIPIIDQALQSGDVSYDTLAPDLKSTLVLKYNDSSESITFSNTNSLLKTDGTIGSYTGNYAVSDYIDCSTWYGLKFSGRQYYDGQCLAFYNSDHVYINNSAFPNSTSGYHDYVNQIISIPQGAKYARFAQYGNTATHVYSATAYIPAHIGAKWLGKKWVCIGDSLTEVNSAAAKRYHDYIADYTGITVVNLGVGGTGYMNGGSNSNPFRNRVPDIPLDTDVITIFGSFNDLGDTRPLGTETDTGTDTVGGCINTTLDAIFERITLANIGIVTPTPWGNAYPLDNESTGSYRYVQLLKDICERRGIPCLDLFHCSQLRPWDSTFRSAAYSNDSTGVHPDENGQKLIAPRFEGFLDSLLLV